MIRSLEQLTSRQLRELFDRVALEGLGRRSDASLVCLANLSAAAWRQRTAFFNDLGLVARAAQLELERRAELEAT